ncbi:terpenoid synthase [Armillaria luteobubalina]|uniref:Terpene synthase n=1 Tax=Armillaria luteobubalina TaxID=153913 RepID=A0AA39QI03_9AGAR|nr:terpenoid synthase [Armillaria luteobubalina]
MGTQSEVLFRIPDTLMYWPWPRKINPHHEEVKTVSDAWFRSLKAFEPEAQRHASNQLLVRAAHCCLLASLGCPTARKEHLRTVCDLMHLLFTIDDYTDDAPVEVVRLYAEIVMDAVNNPIKPRPSDEVVLGVIAQQFWALGVKSASSTSQKHFVESLKHYVDALVQEAEDRHHHRVRNVEEYFDIRRWNIGIYMVYAMLELSYDMPDDVFNHPTVAALRSAGRDLMIMDNDLASYNKEQALEKHPHNILVCVMNEQKCDLHDALSWVEDTYRSTRNKFLMLWTEIPLWGPEMDVIASHYLHGIANWRYFGANDRDVRQHRMVLLMPKRLFGGWAASHTRTSIFLAVCFVILSFVPLYTSPLFLHSRLLE